MRLRSIAGRHSSSTFLALAMLAGNMAVLFGPLRPTLTTFAAQGLLIGLVGSALWLDRLTRTRFSPEARIAIKMFGVACVTALCTLVFSLDQLAQRWSSQDERARVIADLEVTDLPRRVGGSIEFDAELEIVSPDRLARKMRARVVWREPPMPLPRAGERWRLLLQMSAPRMNRNPGGFDEQREFFRDRIHARAVVLPFADNRRLAAQSSGLLALRENIARRVRDSVIDRDAAALFAGLAVGATGEVSREQWQTFSNTGTTHLVAISGMHVTLFCWIVAALARATWRRLPTLARTIDRETFAASLGVPAATGYALLAGFGIPTQRTVVMLAVWWLLRLAGRVHSDFDVLGIALIVVLLIDPFAPLSSGFWLSFVAMMTLIISGEPQGRGVIGWIRDNLRTQWHVSIALLPLTLIWFSSVSLAGLLVNLVAIPVFSFVLVPVALLGSALGAVSAWVARPLWWIGEQVHEFLWPMLVAIAAHPLAALELNVMSYLPGVAMERPAEAEVMATLLEAGDGTALIVRTRAHALVYDTGEHYDSDGRGAERLVVPALAAMGVRELDLLMLSRSHAYRAAGAARLLAEVPVARVVGGGDWPGAARPVESCTEARHWRWDGVDFYSVAVEGGSCVLWVGFSQGPGLLVPERIDATEAQALPPLVQAINMPLRATVVMAPRRGSPDAVPAAFAKQVDAQWVLLAGGNAALKQRQRVATTWNVDVTRVVATALRGAVTLHLRAGLPPRWLEQAALQGGPIWRYHPEPTSAR